MHNGTRKLIFTAFKRSHLLKGTHLVLSLVISHHPVQFHGGLAGLQLLQLLDGLFPDPPHQHHQVFHSRQQEEGRRKSPTTLKVADPQLKQKKINTTRQIRGCTESSSSTAKAEKLIPGKFAHTLKVALPQLKQKLTKKSKLSKSTQLI